MYLVAVFAYDVYLEVEWGDLGQIWKDNKIVDFWKFYDLLSNQRLKYNQTHRKYAGDTNIITATQKN